MSIDTKKNELVKCPFTSEANHLVLFDVNDSFLFDIMHKFRLVGPFSKILLSNYLDLFKTCFVLSSLHPSLDLISFVQSKILPFQVFPYNINVVAICRITNISSSIYVHKRDLLMSVLLPFFFFNGNSKSCKVCKSVINFYCSTFAPPYYTSSRILEQLPTSRFHVDVYNLELLKKWGWFDSFYNCCNS